MGTARLRRISRASDRLIGEPCPQRLYLGMRKMDALLGLNFGWQGRNYFLIES